MYIFSFLPETNVLLHNTRGRTSLFSRGYSTTQYQILSPMAYHLTEDEKQSVAILRLKKFNPLMYNRAVQLERWVHVGFPHAITSGEICGDE